jgi:hypothetical protein
MTLVLFLHLACAFLWLGCVLVEGVFERVGDGSDATRLFISRAHWRIDRIVEIPAFSGVLATGAFMIAGVELSPLLLLKIAAGSLAIGFNIYCVVLVRSRLRAAEAGDFARWAVIDHSQHRHGAAVLAAMVVALAIGGYLFVAG